MGLSLMLCEVGEGGGGGGGGGGCMEWEGGSVY